MSEPEQQAIEKSPDASEYFADAIYVESFAYGTTFHFGDHRPGMPALIKVSVKMSPQLAKVLAMIVEKLQVKYETEIGEIPVLKEIKDQFGKGE